jgi:farnesyl diphosphate synthase
MPSFQQQLENYQKRIEQQLQQVLTLSPSRLHQAMTYSVMNGGKRLRPVLVYATADTLNIPLEHVDKIACAVELIHCYSLIHDDLPDMDNDDWRRGKPTCHKAFDNAIAILAGDALQTLAFELLAQTQASFSTEQQLKIIQLLAQAIGRDGMAYGQELDISHSDQISAEELESIHINKTGKLISACVQLSLLAGEIDDDSMQQALAKYADCLGLAFQVQDDILDEEGTIDELGKLPGVDSKLAKATYPAVHGMVVAKRILRQLHDQAMKSLDGVQLHDSFLGKLADFVVSRKT